MKFDLLHGIYIRHLMKKGSLASKVLLDMSPKLSKCLCTSLIDLFSIWSRKTFVDVRDQKWFKILIRKGRVHTVTRYILAFPSGLSRRTEPRNPEGPGTKKKAKSPRIFF